MRSAPEHQPVEQRAHLGYCTNIHPGETWEEVERNLLGPVARVRDRVCPRDEPFGIGLRLSAVAARSLATNPAPLRRALDRLNAYVFTINGFPYGRFHGAPVKAGVYLPDWRQTERVRYTRDLAEILATILPAGIPGSISTVPGCFDKHPPAEDRRRMADHLLEACDTLDHLEAATGKRIALALEPEPCCFLETTAEAIAFLTEAVYARAQSERIARRHLGVCLDTCHAAVEFEGAAAAVAALERAGILLAKVQLSAGLRVASVTPKAVAALGAFEDDVYLHQVVERDGAGQLRRFVDMPEAIADYRARPDDEREWRIHFHVPLHGDIVGSLCGTHADLEALLALHRERPVCKHLEVETYTWDVLPAALRSSDVAEDVARELEWVMERL